MKKNKNFFIILGLICVLTFAFHIVLLVNFTVPEKASVGGKYQHLLYVIKSPKDKDQYSNFKDLEYVKNDFVVLKELSSGYWVYLYPNWYIWESLNSDNTPKKLTEEQIVAEEFKKKAYPSIHEEINSISGFNVTIEVDWESLSVKNWSHIFNHAYKKIYFNPITNALKQFTSNEKKKKALSVMLKKIIIKNTGKYFNSNGFSFNNGILIIDHQPQANIDDEKEREDYILQLFETSYKKFKEN
jgi:hypothetical protein